jgi:hypothetical protein
MWDAATACRVRRGMFAPRRAIPRPTATLDDRMETWAVEATPRVRTEVWAAEATPRVRTEVWAATRDRTAEAASVRRTPHQVAEAVTTPRRHIVRAAEASTAALATAVAADRTEAADTAKTQSI